MNTPLKNLARLALFAALALPLACSKPHADDDGHDHGEEAGHKEEGKGEAGHDDHGTPELELSLASQDSVGLTLAPVERRNMGGNTALPARVELDPGRTAHISAPVPGRFTQVPVTQGQRVKAGDLLALVRAADTAQLNARAAELRAELVFAQGQLARQEKLGDVGVGATRQLEEARATTRRLKAELAGLTSQLQIAGARGAGDLIALTSPIDGIIVNQHAMLGEAAGPDKDSFVISDPSQVWIVGEAPERLISAVAEGVHVTVRLHAWPERALSGKLDYIAPALDGQAHTLPVRMNIPNPDGALKAGMFGSMELLGQEAQPLTVPSSAVLLIDGAHTVFVPEDDAPRPTHFRPVQVEIGRRDEALIEIKAGVEAGQRVVTRGAFTLKSLLKRDEVGAGHVH